MPEMPPGLICWDMFAPFKADTFYIRCSLGLSHVIVTMAFSSLVLTCPHVLQGHFLLVWLAVSQWRVFSPSPPSLPVFWGRLEQTKDLAFITGIRSFAF